MTYYRTRKEADAVAREMAETTMGAYSHEVIVRIGGRDRVRYAVSVEPAPLTWKDRV